MPCEHLISESDETDSEETDSEETDSEETDSEGTDLTSEQGPLGFEPTPEMPLATTYEGQSSPLLLPEEWGERPSVRSGIEIPSAIHEVEGSLLANPPSPPLTPPTAPMECEERPEPVPATGAPRGGVSREFERNCDTISAATTTSSGRATFAPAPVQNVSKPRLKFKGFQEMSCKLENCRAHGGHGNPGTKAAAIVGSNRDSGATLAASPHSQSEDQRPVHHRPFSVVTPPTLKCWGRKRQGRDWGRAAARIIRTTRDSGATLVTSMHSGNEARPEYNQHLGGVYCVPEQGGGCEVDVGGRVKLPEKKKRRRRVDWIWMSWLATLTRGVTVHPHPAAPGLDNPDTSLSRVNLSKF